MPRPYRCGIEYTSLDTSFFSDRKVKRLLLLLGTKGLSVYLYLLCEIYRNKGYFVGYDVDLCTDIATCIPGVSEQSAQEIILACISIGLFDKGLYESCKILTSKSIQDRYSFAKRGRAEIDPRFRVNVAISGIDVTETQVDVAETQVDVASIPHSKEKKRKENGTSPYRPLLDDVKNYCKERSNGVDPERWFNFYSAKGWMIGKNPMKDWKAAVRTWEKSEGGKNESESRYRKLG